MSDRPTPETDAETMRDEYDHVDSDFGPFASSDTVPADYARRLERERDEARKAAIALIEKGCDRECAPLYYAQRLERERDEAREKYFAMRELSNNATELAEKYKQERDEAREALGKSFAARLHDFFKGMRFDKNHHLGLGDIRLTLGQQEELAVALCERDEAIAARKSSAADWLGQIEQANTRVSRALQQVAMAERERDEAMEIGDTLCGLVCYGMGTTGENWSFENMRDAREAIHRFGKMQEAAK